MARAANELQWAPESLYNTAISAVVMRFGQHKIEMKNLTDDVIFDIYYKLYDKNGLGELSDEFKDLDVFAKVLKVSNKRILLHRSFQAIMDNDLNLADILAHSFCRRLSPRTLKDSAAKDKVLHLGFLLGGFLSEAGWFGASASIYTHCLDACFRDKGVGELRRTMEFAVKLLHSQNFNCDYKHAEETYQKAIHICQKIETQGAKVNKAVLHAEHCALLFAQSRYSQAFNACYHAICELNDSMPPTAVVNVLRLCSKACVVKREFKTAQLIIKYAVAFARETFGKHHPKHADTLLDYGFYLLNSDSVDPAVQVYQIALDIRQSVFGGNNLYVAIASEDLAYASYVKEYSSGKFHRAKDHVDKSLQILSKILPEDHLLSSSSKRVKALILEETGIDCNNKEEEMKYLEEALSLHLYSLEQARRVFGEENVQTAKHYGNLGRLFQSMKRFKEAETMHKKAIAIKDRLLGPDDYEVALSIGHLASLFNYDMHNYDEAEKLYLRSVKIGRKLFGEGYSGLEYDYRGLMRLYTLKSDTEKAAEYNAIINQWSIIRDTNTAKAHYMTYLCRCAFLSTNQEGQYDKNNETNPLDYEMDMTVADLVEIVLKTPCFYSMAHCKGSKPESSERSSGE